MDKMHTQNLMVVRCYNLYRSPRIIVNSKVNSPIKQEYLT